MNERIAILMNQAREQYRNQDLPHEQGLIAYSEKFAELIVKECIELNKQELSFNAFERMLNRYKEHFGVEE